MLAYARVCSRMLAYGRVVAVWRCEARHGSVSLSDYRLLQYISPALHSYRFLDVTYRLSRPDIASFISDIGACYYAEPRERVDYLTTLTVAYKALRLDSSLIVSLHTGSKEV